MKIKVAIILPYFGPGGVEHMVSELASHLDLQRVDAEVICVYGNPQNNEMEKAILNHGVPIHYIRKKLGFSFKAMLRVYKELNHFNPDVIHTHLSGCIYASLWVLCHSVKMLHTVHSTPLYEFGKIKRTIMSFLYYTGKAVPVGISNEICKMIVQLYNLKYFPELVYNPVDIQRFVQVKKTTHQAYRVIAVGRLEYPKNHVILIDAFAKVVEKIPNAQLYILGDGSLRKQIKERIKHWKLQDHVILKGKVNDVENYLACSDVFVMCSDYEGLPLSILEAMAAGLPIVSTDVGGIKDIVTDNGILTHKGNVEELANALIQLGINPVLRKQYAMNSFANVAPFDTSLIANKYIDLYKKYGGHGNK